MEDTVLKIKTAREVLFEILRTNRRNSETYIEYDHDSTLKLFFEKLQYDFSCFDEDIKNILQLDYSKFNNRDVWFSDGELAKFIQNIITAKEKSSMDNMPKEGRFHAFYLTLFTNIMKEQGKTQEINSRVRFLSGILDEVISGSTPEKLAPPNTCTSSQCPRVIIEFGINTCEGCEVTVTLEQLLEHMFDYMFTKYSTPQYPHLFGILLDLDAAEVFWVENFVPGEVPKSSQITLYRIVWNFHNLMLFIDKVKKGDAFLHHKLDADDYEDILPVLCVL